MWFDLCRCWEGAGTASPAWQMCGCEGSAAALVIISPYLWQVRSCAMEGSVSGDVRKLWEPRAASLLGFCSASWL